MNGYWFPWAEDANGNRPGESRHSDLGLVPNVDFEDKLRSLASLYPGKAFVEWTCLDGYNSGTNPAKDDRWRSFDQLYQLQIEAFAAGIRNLG